MFQGLSLPQQIAKLSNAIWTPHDTFYSPFIHVGAGTTGESAEDNISTLKDLASHEAVLVTAATATFSQLQTIKR